MKSTFFKVSALLALTVAASPARADFIEWEYNWQPSASLLFAGSVEEKSGTGTGVQLSNEPGDSAAGNSDIVATNIAAFSTAPRGAPVIMGARGDFTLTLTLKDIDSGQQTVLNFGAKLSGPISEASADLDLEFTTPISQTALLGDHTYTVVIGPYSPPGPPGSTNAGSIAAFVSVTDDTPVQNAPEPSTMVLSCVGLAFLGLRSWRARRKRAQLATL